MKYVFLFAIAINFVTHIAMPHVSAGQDETKPPVAEYQPTELKMHGQIRIDEYYWMKDREDPKVIEYLKAENVYMKSQLASTEELQKKLFEETRNRIKQTDTTVPVPERGYDYYSHTIEGKQYSIYCRQKQSSRKQSDPAESETAEEVLLDVNQLAEGQKFCSVRGMRVSTNNKLLAYAVDLVGRRKYTMRVKDLTTGKLLADEIKDITGNLVWAEDNKTLFYTRQDPQTLRSYQIYRHELGTDSTDDVLVYQEDDEEFSCGVFKTRSRKYVIIACRQTLSNEYRFINATAPKTKPQILQARERNHEHSIDHLDDHFFILTNWNAKNFRLMKTPDTETGKQHWKELIGHDEHILLEDFELFSKFLVVGQRREGLTRLKIFPWETFENPHELDFGEPCYVAGASAIPEPKTEWLRYRFSSLRTPPSTFEYNMRTKEKRLLKQQEVLGGFDRDNYRTQRQWAAAKDGTKIPVSIVYHKDTPLNGTAPCLEYGYGSYGASMDARFNTTILNLVNRGFVYAIAHIRGGQEMGRDWYDDGKLLKKKNTFSDFVDVGDFLVKQKFADPKRLYARGGSAGGLLMGAVVNLRPKLYHGVVADVPFVDVITTMLDDSIPLTTSEYDEWGNPNDLKYYNYMLSYSPYDNVAASEYPNMLVTTGLHDSQVQYWEPAKWVARMRALKTDDNLLLLKTNMDAGHGGASGRYDRYKEVALRHAFLIHLAGKNKP